MRIIQEALTNIMRHTQAQHRTIKLAISEPMTGDRGQGTKEAIPPPQLQAADPQVAGRSASSANYEIPLGTDTFVIRGGKIMAQTFAGQIISNNN